jgi:hypothetical protein
MLPCPLPGDRCLDGRDAVLTQKNGSVWIARFLGHARLLIGIGFEAANFVGSICTELRYYVASATTAWLTLIGVIAILVVAAICFVNFKSAYAMEIVSMAEIGITASPEPIVIRDAAPDIEPGLAGLSIIALPFESRLVRGRAASFSNFCFWRDDDISGKPDLTKIKTFFFRVFAIFHNDPPGHLSRRQVAGVVNNDIAGDSLIMPSIWANPARLDADKSTLQFGKRSFCGSRMLLAGFRRGFGGDNSLTGFAHLTISDNREPACEEPKENSGEDGELSVIRQSPILYSLFIFPFLLLWGGLGGYYFYYERNFLSAMFFGAGMLEIVLIFWLI